MDLVKYRTAQGKNPELYFYRDSHGNEIDVLTEIERFLTPIEIKSSATFQKHLLKTLEFYHSSIDKQCEHSFLIYSGSSGAVSEKTEGLHFINSSKVFKANNPSS